MRGEQGGVEDTNPLRKSLSPTLHSKNYNDALLQNFSLTSLASLSIVVQKSMLMD